MSHEGYDIDDLVRLTGLEESQIRYYESAFASLMPQKVVLGTEYRFAERAVEVFRKVHRAVSERGGQVDLAVLARQLDTFDQARDTPEEPVAPSHILAVTSGKGGVGKSNVALNLAVASSQAGKRVILFDADMGTGNQHILAGLKPGPTLVDCLRGGIAVDEIVRPGPAGIGVVAGGTGMAELADMPESMRSRFMEQLVALAKAADLVVVDTGTGISRMVVGFACTGDALTVVTTPDLTAITDAYGLLKTVARVASRIPAGVVVNNTPSAAVAKDVFHRLERCSAQFLDLGLEYLGPVYRDPAVVRAVARRYPFVLDAPESRAGRSLRRVAHTISDWLSTLPACAGQGELWPRVTSRDPKPGGAPSLSLTV